MGYRKGENAHLFQSAKRRKNLLLLKKKTHVTLPIHTSTVPNYVAESSLNLTQTNEASTSSASYSRQNLKQNVSSISSSTPVDLVMEPEKSDGITIHEELEGRRIVDKKFLFPSLANIKHDHTNSTFADLTYVKEIRKGLVSEYVFKCRMCSVKEILYSELPSMQVSANFAIVEGIICTGNGYFQLNEICGSLNMPCMSRGSYTKIERYLEPMLEECALEEMIVAGQEEKRLAILNGDIDEESYPLVTVVADGSWGQEII